MNILNPKSKIQNPKYGYTLVEMSVALVATALLTVAMISSMVLSTRGLEVVAGAADHTQSAESLADFMSECRLATNIVSTATGITLTVPDRTGDGSADTIAYTWSGSPGNPLMKAVNGGAASAVLESVDSIALDYKVVPENPEDPDATTAIVSEHTASGSTSNESVNSLNLSGQYFVPNLPSGTQNWTPTKVVIYGRNSTGSSGTIALEIQTVSGLGTPTGTILCGATVDVSGWSSSFDWREATFTSAPSLPPTQAVCLVVKRITATNTIHLQSNSGSGASDLLTGTLGGIFWSKSSFRALRHEIHGTYVGPPQSSGVVHLHWIQCAVQRTTDPDSRMVLSTELLNRPEATGFD